MISGIYNKTFSLWSLKREKMCLSFEEGFFQRRDGCEEETQYFSFIDFRPGNNFIFPFPLFYPSGNLSQIYEPPFHSSDDLLVGKGGEYRLQVASPFYDFSFLTAGVNGIRGSALSHPSRI